MVASKKTPNSTVLKLTRELRQRDAELQIINSVQAGLASKLDMQGIYDLVGDKIREIFDVHAIQLISFDHKKNLMYRNYLIEKGQRLYVDPLPISKVWAYFISNPQRILLNNVENFIAQVDPGFTPPAGHAPRSLIAVPLMVNGELKGAIDLENLDRENAFSESDLRLLETLANSMSIALENARLFDETQQRNAELAIINSVQAALAAQLDIHGIFEAVGEKLREIFNYQDVTIYSADLRSRIVTVEYSYELGQKSERRSVRMNSLYEYFLASNRTFVFNGDLPSLAAKFSDYQNPEPPKSLLAIPVR